MAPSSLALAPCRRTGRLLIPSPFFFLCPALPLLPGIQSRELDAPVQPTPSSSRGRASTLVLGSSPPMAPPPTSFAQPLWRPSSLLPPSPMQQHVSSPSPSSSLSRPGNTGSHALSGLGGAAPLPALSLPNSAPLLQASSSSLSMAPLQYSPSSPSASHGAAPLILHPRTAAAELAPPPLAAQPLDETPLFLQPRHLPWLPRC
jgi:hypothetical protein